MTNHNNMLFVSYARDDYAAVRPVLLAVRQMGVELWSEVEDLTPGQRWDEQVKQALERATGLLIFISTASSKSATLRRELQFFLQTNRLVIPVLLDHSAILPPSLEQLLATMQIIDLSVRRNAIEIEQAAAVIAQVAVSAGHAKHDEGRVHTKSLEFLENEAAIRETREDRDTSLALLKEAERKCRKIGNKDGLQRSLGKQAAILQGRGDLSAAMALLKEAEQICREIGDVAGLQSWLANQGWILNAQGDLNGAMILLKEAERVSRQMGSKDSLQLCLGNQAGILEARGDLDTAMTLLKEQERISRDLGNVDGLQRSLQHQARILQKRGDLIGAEALLREQEHIVHEMEDTGDLRALAQSLAADARKRPTDAQAGAMPRSVFIVHGHDEALLKEVESFLLSLNVKGVVLRRIGGPAQSLFQKFMQWGSDTRFAVVLLTGDDFGSSRIQYEADGVGQQSLQYRARQNVILELGFFYGHLGWENVFVLYKPPDRVFPNFERPSDLDGVVFDYVDSSAHWRSFLVSKLKEAGFDLVEGELDNSIKSTR
jgi:predicted nucleotide-binding protein